MPWYETEYGPRFALEKFIVTDNNPVSYMVTLYLEGKL